MRLCTLLLVLAAPCAAQSTVPGGSGGGADARTRVPVSMVFERKQVQTLADGTHITSVTHESFYRDSQGRTRSDQELPFPVRSGTPMVAVTVQDPVAGFMLHWQTGGEAAAQRRRQFTSVDTDATRAQALQERAEDAAAAALPRLQRDPAPAQAGHPQPKHTTQSLGMQEVQGIPCEATRSATVYPVDSIGNDRAITVWTERCVSREFGRALREVSEDPRSGTRTLTLQSVTRGEPDPMVFHPPADYGERSQTP